MELVILKVGDWRESRQGARYRYVFFKDELTGQSYKSCIYEAMRNYTRWKDLLEPGNVLSGLRERSKGLIDADSQPVFVRHMELPEKIREGNQ